MGQQAAEAKPRSAEGDDIPPSQLSERTSVVSLTHF